MSNRNFVSGLLAGVTAAVIWMSIGLWQNVGASTVGMWGFILFVATTIVATIITSVVSRNDAARRGPAA